MPRDSDDRARWRATFWTLLFVTLVTKLLLASYLSLFVDEAFYWQESRHLAWTYSDLPPLTAWLIRAGETLFGHSTLALRSLFIVMSLLIAWVVRSICARHFGERLGWQAGCWALVLPLLASFGVLALPDVPLTLLCLLAVDALDRLAGQPRRWSIGVVLGFWLALAWLTHYRAAMLWAAGIVYLLATPRGRRLWKSPGHWIAVVIGLLGLLPLLLGDQVIGADAMRFQLLDRHPWAFHADALVQPLEQALVTTPVLYLLLLAAMVAAWRRVSSRQPSPLPWDLVGIVAGTFLVGYFVLGLFADGQRFRVHWPLPGYLALFSMLPALLDQWQRRWPMMRWATWLSAAGAIIGTMLVYAYFVAAATVSGASALSQYKAFPEHFVGWDQAAATTRSLLATPELADAILVADNFMLAAQLDFALDSSTPIYSLDHPLNTKHGRAAQLRLWQRDETGLTSETGKNVLLVVEETAGRERDKALWLNGLCQRVADLRPVATLNLYDGRKRFAWFRGTVSKSYAGTDCVYPPSSESINWDLREASRCLLQGTRQPQTPEFLRIIAVCAVQHV
ncbi:MAG: glycosyltransferase family 39 protein [Dokdonella sp.]